jgi:hypothetical protein
LELVCILPARRLFGGVLGICDFRHKNPRRSQISLTWPREPGFSGLSKIVLRFYETPAPLKAARDSNIILYWYQIEKTIKKLSLKVLRSPFAVHRSPSPFTVLLPSVQDRLAYRKNE